MKLAVINGASKTSLSILKSLFKNYPALISKVNLIDFFPNYGKFEDVFEFKDSLTPFPNISLSKLGNKNTLSQTLSDSDILLYFTHDYFENVTCKNELKKSVAQIANSVPNLEKSIFVNLLEYSQLNEPHYLEQSLSADHELTQLSDKHIVLWTDFIYGNDASLGHHLKTTRFVNFDQNPKNWVHVDKVAKLVSEAIEGKVKNQLNYIEKNEIKTGKQIVYDLELGEDGASVTLPGKILSNLFSSAEEKHYLHLLNTHFDLEHKLAGYHKLNAKGSYPNLSESSI